MRRSPWFLLAALTAACGSAGAVTETTDTPGTLPTAPPTIPGVGSLPDTIPARRQPLVVVTRPVTEEGVLVELIGDQVSGNRLLVVGDSIFAATASRYGGEMCDELVPLGWAVEVEAEAGRFVEFGVKVVNRLVPDPPDPATTDNSATDNAATDNADDWDAAAVFLGSNYDGNQGNYDEELRKIVARLAPRPTLLYTVTEYRSTWSQVNDVIHAVAADYENVSVIEWGDVAKTPGVLRADGLHPSAEGAVVLAQLTAAALGRVPRAEGECLRSQYRDDSAIRDGNGSPVLTSGGSGSGSGGSGSSGTTTTTIRPRPTTTVPGGSTGSTTTVPKGGTTTTVATGGSSTTVPNGGGGTTVPSPPTTSPPPATTSPPATSPPATTSPPTAPPTTKPEEGG